MCITYSWRQAWQWILYLPFNVWTVPAACWLVQISGFPQAGRFNSVCMYILAHLLANSCITCLHLLDRTSSWL